MIDNLKDIFDKTTQYLLTFTERIARQTIAAIIIFFLAVDYICRLIEQIKNSSMTREESYIVAQEKKFGILLPLFSLFKVLFVLSFIYLPAILLIIAYFCFDYLLIFALAWTITITLIGAVKFTKVSNPDGQHKQIVSTFVIKLYNSILYYLDLYYRMANRFFENHFYYTISDDNSEGVLMFGKLRNSTSPLIELGVIGRPESGKTVLNLSLHFVFRDFVTESGFMFGPVDPRAHINFNEKLEAAVKTMQNGILPSTFTAEFFDYCLYYGSHKPATIRVPEVIGQVQTVSPDSDKENERIYNEYLSEVGRADVLWTIIPIDPNHDPIFFRKIIADSLAFQRTALANRTEKCAIAIVLSRIDTYFSSPDEAKKEMTDEYILRQLRPLISAIKAYDQVEESAIFPVSSFGFNNTIKKEVTLDEENIILATSFSDQEFQNHNQQQSHHSKKPVWVLKEGAYFEPYNIDALLIWSLYAGLLNKSFSNQFGPFDKQKLCDNLLNDLYALDGWFIPVKGEGSS